MAPNARSNPTKTHAQIRTRARLLAGLFLFGFRFESVARRQPVCSHFMEDPRRVYQRRDQCNCANARWLSMAGNGIRLGPLRWHPERPMAATKKPATPLHRYSELARHARRDSLDWYGERAGKLERRETGSVRGAYRTKYFQPS